MNGDIVALGGDLHWRTLVDAYSKGIFPWPTDELPAIPWFCPSRRAMLFFDEIHMPRSLRRIERKLSLEYTIDRAFERVIRACAQAPRPGQDGTWIFPEVVEAYTELHRRGIAHSAEAWLDGELVAGVYGVDAGGAFGGESMFHTISGASKLVLLHLCRHLESRGAKWLDAQVMTTHVEVLGAREIPKRRFLKLLEEAQMANRVLFDREVPGET